MDKPGTAQPDQHTRITLIHPRYLVPVRPQGVVYDTWSVAITDDLIVRLLPRDEAERSFPAAEVIELPDHVLLPGLINMHTHSPMNLLRGYADDMSLHVWLRQHIWPAEQEFVGPEFVTDGTRLAIVEMLRGGTTCFNDMYFFPDAIASACQEAGIRASIGVPLIEDQSATTTDIDEYFEQGLELHRKWQAEPLLSFTLAPHAPYTVTDETLQRVATYSEERDIPVHLHLLETEWDIKHSLQHHDMHPLRRLKELNLLNSRLQAVHMTQLSMEDISTLAESGVHVVHCPQSNLKLASGICPLASLLEAGINVSLGTDGVASNNDLDLLAEAQTAALLAKGISGNAEAVNAFQALEMMTINGARALGMDTSIGSIEPGKAADFCAIDLSCPETQPLHHVVSQVIYAASRRQVSDVWVAGRRVLESGQLTSIDLEETTSQARQWAARLRVFDALNRKKNGEKSRVTM
jgi:5-methylthioadenosine/S-adenosylhomocysteine deaminase